MSATTPASTLASHLISQIRSNLSVLEQLDVIPAQDADAIRTKLPPPSGPFPSLATAAAVTSPQATIGGLARSGSIEMGVQRLAIGGGAGGSSHSINHGQVTSPVKEQEKQLTQYGGSGPPALPLRSGTGQGQGQESRARALWDYNGNVSLLPSG